MAHPSKLGLPPDLQSQSKGSKMRRTFAGLAMASFLMLGFANIANAQVVCSQENAAPTNWPPANAAIDCSSGPGPSGFLRSTLETIGQNGTDAAARLKNETITPGQTIGLNITNVDGTTTISKLETITSAPSDTVVLLANKMVAAIQNDSDLNSILYAYSFGGGVNIISFSGSTTYSIDPGSTFIPTPTLSFSDPWETLTIAGPPRSNITWFEFPTQTDYYNSVGVSGAPTGPREMLTATDFGNTLQLLKPSPSVGTYYESEVFDNSTAALAPDPNGYNHGGSATNVTAHAVAHETGHELDYRYANNVNIRTVSNNLTGSPTPGDIFTINITDGSTIYPAITYTVQPTDTTLQLIATGVANAINAAHDSGITAMAVGNSVVITSTTANGTTYSITVNTGATEHISVPTANSAVSGSTVFAQALAYDKKYMNMVQPCYFDVSDRLDFDGVSGGTYEARPGDHGYYASSGMTTPNSSGGSSGLFTSAVDSNGNQVCNNRTSNIAGGTNTAIFQTAYPRININDDGVSELFAEEYSVIAGFPDTMDNSGNPIYGSDTGIGALVCTNLFVSTLTSYGRLPNADELASTGYYVPQTFTDDSNGVTFGPKAPPNPDGSGNYTQDMYAFLLYPCDGSDPKPGYMANYGF